MDTTLTLIENLLSGKFGVSATALDVDRTFEQLDVDSLALAELTLLLQEQLGVAIHEEDVVKSMTLAEAASAVDAKIAAESQKAPSR